MWAGRLRSKIGLLVAAVPVVGVEAEEVSAPVEVALMRGTSVVVVAVAVETVKSAPA